VVDALDHSTWVWDFTQKIRRSARQLSHELLLVHAIFERFASIDEHDGDLIVILTSEFYVGVDIYFAPVKAAALMEFDEALLDDFAEMTPLPGINDNFPLLHNGGSVTGWNPVSKIRKA
jgi:hypothetical protein